MTETAAYREWLTTAPTARGIIDTVEITATLNGVEEQIFLTNWDQNITCYLEDADTPRDQEFQAARFIVEPAAVVDGTQQSTSISIAAYNGVVYDTLKAMTPEDRKTPVTVRPRLYYTDDFTTQLINPSPVWSMTNVSASFDAVSGTLEVLPMRAYRVGRYYTARGFPILKVAM